jgi:hypothetical protein
VTVGGFSAVLAGYTITHRRIYRATSGVFLFVAEIAVATSSYSDSIVAEDLGEELPSLTWLPPPDTLKGLINLPGGVMAGFTGRDVYFCDPYHPQAWPVQYMQSLLQGLPIAAQSYSYMQPSQLSQVLSGAGGIQELFDLLTGGGGTNTAAAGTTS